MSCDIREYIPKKGEAMKLTAYCGGAKDGHSIQFSIGDRYCCLSEEALEDLIYTLSARIDLVDGYTATGEEREDLVYKEED